MPSPRSPHTSADEEFVALIALGVLEQDEQRGFAPHLQGCEPCQAILAQDRHTVATLSLVTVDIEPSPGFKQRLLQRAAEKLQKEGYDV